MRIRIRCSNRSKGGVGDACCRNVVGGHNFTVDEGEGTLKLSRDESDTQSPQQEGEGPEQNENENSFVDLAVRRRLTSRINVMTTHTT